MNRTQSWTQRFVVAGLAACCLSICWAASGQGLPDVDGRGSMFGKHAPAFRIKGAYGEVYSMDRLRGNIILMQFGTSW